MNFLTKILYNFALQSYYILANLISPFNKKAFQWVNGRKIPITKIQEESIWFHCASLGEFEQARPLLEKIKTEYPFYKIVLTFYSPSGYEVRKDYKKADYIYYLPLDTKKNALDFILKTNPKLVFFVKYEFWYHFINELKNKNIPTFLVSGIFRKNQSFFKSYGAFFRSILNNFTHLFVQDDNSLALLHSIDIKNTSKANDSRFDRVYDIYKEAREYPEIENFIDKKKCIIIGSSWLEDEKLFVQLLNKYKENKFIIAPHNINKTRLKELSNLFTNHVLYSKIKANSKEKQVLIIDNIGMLSSIYRYGDIAYIGGGFGVSIHNILEAVVYSIPVIFGPAHKKMKEASDLIKLKAAFEINNIKELNEVLDRLDDAIFLKKSANKAGNYVLKNLGGTEKVLSYIKKEKILEIIK